MVEKGVGTSLWNLVIGRCSNQRWNPTFESCLDEVTVRSGVRMCKKGRPEVSLSAYSEGVNGRNVSDDTKLSRTF